MALACLEAPLEVPVAPPTHDALLAMVESLEETRSAGGAKATDAADVEAANSDDSDDGG